MLIEIAEGRALPATEGVIGDRHRDRHVDTHHADIHLRGEIARRVTVAGEDRHAIPVFMVVGERETLMEALGAHHGEHGAEDLLLVDAHVLGHIVEQATAHVEAVLVALHGEAAPVHGEGCAFLDADFDVILVLSRCALVTNGAEIGAGISRGADLEGFDARDQLFHQAGSPSPHPPAPPPRPPPPAMQRSPAEP